MNNPYEKSSLERLIQREEAMRKSVERVMGKGSHPQAVMDVADVLKYRFDTPPKPKVDIKAICEKISYKKEWTLNASGWAGLPSWSWLVQDAVTLSETKVRIYGPPIMVNDQMSEEEVVRHIFESIKQCEMHEAQEFFRYENKIIYDPHKIGVV